MASCWSKVGFEKKAGIEWSTGCGGSRRTAAPDRDHGAAHEPRFRGQGTGDQRDGWIRVLRERPERGRSAPGRRDQPPLAAQAEEGSVVGPWATGPAIYSSSEPTTVAILARRILMRTLSAILRETVPASLSSATTVP
jgi:hypothetical protein